MEGWKTKKTKLMGAKCIYILDLYDSTTYLFIKKYTLLLMYPYVESYGHIFIVL